MSVSLTPTHRAQLNPEFEYLIAHAPDQDVVIRTLSRKLNQDRPLIQGDLVLAGRETRASYPRAQDYPVHFRKTYYPGAFHPPATREFDNHEKVAAVLDIPPPIGATANCFRSCFIPGIPLNRISPFGVEPADQNLVIAEQTETGLLLGLWSLLENVAAHLRTLHEAGLAHGDLFLHNAIVSKSPIGVHLIDFEQARDRADESGPPEPWEQVCFRDFEEVFRHALWVQAGLGGQNGFLGETSRDQAEALLGESAGRCLRKIESHSLL